MSERDQLIASAMKSGMSREDASILTDVSKHAFEEAFSTATRVLSTVPHHLRLAALNSVLASMADIMRERFPEHWAAFVASDPKYDGVGVIVLPPRQAEKP